MLFERKHVREHRDQPNLVLEVVHFDQAEVLEHQQTARAAHQDHQVVVLEVVERADRLREQDLLFEVVFVQVDQVQAVLVLENAVGVLFQLQNPLVVPLAPNRKEEAHFARVQDEVWSVYLARPKPSRSRGPFWAKSPT